MRGPIPHLGFVKIRQFSGRPQKSRCVEGAGNATKHTTQYVADVSQTTRWGGKRRHRQSVASMFTLSWLFDTLDRAMGLPPMQNSGGDDLMFHDVRFPLTNGVTRKDVATQVNAIPAMAQENAKFWNWLEDKPNGRKKEKQADALPSTQPW